MMKVRDEMVRRKDLRKPEGVISVRIEDFQDLEIRRIARKEILSLIQTKTDQS